MPRRTNTPIELTEDARKIIDAHHDSLGMSKKMIVEKIMAWFAAQNDVVRGSILGTLPESVMVDVARITLERMAQAKPSSRKAS
jgi:hypothetical protein